MSREDDDQASATLAIAEPKVAAVAEREFEQVARAAVRFIEAVANAGLLRNGAGGALSAELLDAGLASGAVEYQLEVRISSTPQVELYAAAGAERIRLLAMRGSVGGIDPALVN